MMPRIKVGFVLPGSDAWVPNGETILVRSRVHARDRLLIAHELQHIVDARRLGLLWIPTYLWLWVRAGFSYRNHPLEKSARISERDPHFIAWAERVIAAL
jgi:hypothetical protein